MWFFLSIFGYFLLAIVTILDKLILTKSIGKPVVYTFYSTIFLLPTLLLWPIGIAPPPEPGLDLVLAFVSSMLFGFGYWTLFISLKTGEASHIEPFIGAIITIISYALGGICLGEVLTHAQVAGVVILVFASFLLSFEKSRKHHGIHIGFFWAIIAGFCFGASLVASKYLYDHYSFSTAIIWTRGLTGLFGIFLW
jgi:drug/metabolite transporter (DMT)-like permease